MLNLRLNQSKGLFAYGKTFAIPNQKHLRVVGEEGQGSSWYTDLYILQAINAGANVFVIEARTNARLWHDMQDAAAKQGRTDCYGVCEDPSNNDLGQLEQNGIIYLSLNWIQQPAKAFGDDLYRLLQFLKTGNTVKNGRPTVVVFTDVQDRLRQHLPAVDAFFEFLVQPCPYTVINQYAGPCFEPPELLDRYEYTVHCTFKFNRVWPKITSENLPVMNDSPEMLEHKLQLSKTIWRDKQPLSTQDEKIIASSPNLSYAYATHCLRGRFELGEPVMAEHQQEANRYLQSCIIPYCPEQYAVVRDRLLTENPGLSLFYQVNTFDFMDLAALIRRGTHVQLSSKTGFMTFDSRNVFEFLTQLHQVAEDDPPLQAVLDRYHAEEQRRIEPPGELPAL